MTQLDYKKADLAPRAPRRGQDRQPDPFFDKPGSRRAGCSGLVRDLAELHDQKKEIVVVSSGAVAAGMTRLGVKERPKTIPEKQALAAVGQIKLMALYERLFLQLREERRAGAADARRSCQPPTLFKRQAYVSNVAGIVDHSRSSMKMTRWRSKK